MRHRDRTFRSNFEGFRPEWRISHRISCLRYTILVGNPRFAISSSTLIRGPAFLSTDAASKLAISFILTRLHYCNSLHAGLLNNKLNKLQCIQNHAARLVLRKLRHVSATSLIRTLHWLSVKARIRYKIPVFSVSITTLYHHIYLTFVIHTIHLSRCALLTPVCRQLLSSESFLCLWLHCLELPTFISQKKKTQWFSTFKKALRRRDFLFEICVVE